ncbi:MAG TPA: hypothetical protein VHV49_21525 [Pseudonocardiaceae bacterium]|nr:hypothetical protein [Pseudonocardiaceae bacterium]
MTKHGVGARLGCAECGASVVVVAWGEPADITCDGGPLAPAATVTGPRAPASTGGISLGKRYVDEAHGVELLAVRAGRGTLCSAGVPMPIKVPKPLPTSD